MNSKKSGTIMIANSILWAAAMIASALVLKDTGHYEEIFLILFSLWFGSFLTFQERGRSAKEEWACIRRYFSSPPKI